MQLLKVMLVALAVTTASASFAQAPNQSGAAVVPPSATFVALPKSPPVPPPTLAAPVTAYVAPTLQFGVDGKVIALTTMRGTTRYEYEKGKRTVVHLPGNVDIRYYYDDGGRIDHTVSSTGVVRTGVYDRRTGKLAEIDGSDGAKLSFSTNGFGAPSVVLTGPNKLKIDYSARAALLAASKKTTQGGDAATTEDDGDEGLIDDGSDGDLYGGWTGGGDGADIADPYADPIGPYTPPPRSKIPRTPAWYAQCFKDCRASYNKMTVWACLLPGTSSSNLAACFEVNDELYRWCNQKCANGEEPGEG